MKLGNNRGLTLIESLVSISLVGALLVGILGAFFISRLGTDRAKHRIVAMNIAREYMERESRAGYLGGYVDGDYYVTVSASSAVPVLIDNRNTASTSDDLMGTIRPSPYPAATSTVGTVRYKVIGFLVEWNEQTFRSGSTLTCRERVATYVAEHS